MNGFPRSKKRLTPSRRAAKIRQEKPMGMAASQESSFGAAEPQRCADAERQPFHLPCFALLLSPDELCWDNPSLAVRPQLASFHAPWLFMAGLCVVRLVNEAMNGFPRSKSVSRQAAEIR